MDAMGRSTLDVVSSTVRVVRVTGRWDRAGASRTADLVSAQCALARTSWSALSDLVVDLSGVSEFGGDALTALVRADAECDRSGVDLHLAGAADRLLRMPVRLRGMVTRFRGFPTVEVALAAISRRAGGPVRPRRPVTG